MPPWVRPPRSARVIAVPVCTTVVGAPVSNTTPVAVTKVVPPVMTVLPPLVIVVPPSTMDSVPSASTSE